MLNTDDPTANKRLQLQDLDIDLASGTVARDGSIIDLPDLSYRLLAALAVQAPAMVSKDQLIETVWEGVVVSDETLMQRVKLLRQALGDDSQNPRYIASVRGRGYRLVAPVTHPPEKRNKWLATATIGLLVAAGIGWLAGEWFSVNDTPATDPAIGSLAVLPFEDLSQGQDYTYFADGMQEELLARLAALDEISVLSRTSAERFRNSDDSIPEIAAALQADAVIEGSVRISGDRIRATIQLSNGADDRHIWAESYEEQLSVANVFAIQQRIADAVAVALQTELQRQNRRNQGLPTASIEAYNAYLLGRYHTFRQTPDALDQAVLDLERAIDIDPEFAEAYAALGWAYSFRGTVYGQQRPDEVFPKARSAALRALELDDRLADAHSLYADILTWYEWNFDLAEVEYRRTVALDPTNVLGYALFLSSQGRHDEAVEMVERRLAVDSGSDYVWVNAAWRYLNAGRLDDAEHAAIQAQNHPDAASVHGAIKLAQGNDEAALANFEQDLANRGRGNLQLINLAYTHFKLGNTAAAQALLDELTIRAEDRFVSSYGLAAIYVVAGDYERSLQLLESAVSQRERSVIFLAINSTFVPLHDDPRFTSLLERIGLDQPDIQTGLL